MAALLQMSGVIVDIIYQVDEVPAPGTEAIVHDFSIKPGGGFNAMVSARRAGLSVQYGGIVGTGPLADTVQKALSDATISTWNHPRGEQDQGCCTVLIDKHSERTFIAREGAEGVLSDVLLNDIDVDSCDWVLLSGYALAYAGSQSALANWASKLPDKVSLVFDPCPLVTQIPPSILHPVMARADWVSANEQEALFLSAEQNRYTAARALCRDRAGAIVRCGSDGCIHAVSDENAVLVEGFCVDAIDTNGAGDTHIGHFIAALSRGEPSLNAARFSNAAAALSVSRRGPATAPALSEVHAFLSLPQHSTPIHSSSDTA